MLFKLKGFNSSPPTNYKEQQEFLSKYIPEYKAGMIALKLDGKIYGLCAERLIFFTRSRVIGDWFGKASWYTVLDILDKPDKLYNHLRKLGVKSLLINKNRITFGEKPDTYKIIFPDTNTTPNYINNGYNYDHNNSFDNNRYKFGEKLKPRNIVFQDTNYALDYVDGSFCYYKKLNLNHHHFVKIYEDNSCILYRLK